MKTAATYVGIFTVVVALEGLALAAGSNPNAASDDAGRASLWQAAAAVEMAEVNFMGITGDTAPEAGKGQDQLAENKAAK